MKQYLDLLKNIAENGIRHPARTDVDRISIYGGFDTFDLTGGKIPLVTTRFISTKALIHELLFFISGAITTKALQDVGVRIWDQWAIKKENIPEFMSTHFGHIPPEEVGRFQKFYEQHISSIGPLYGAIWRNAPCKNPNPIYFDITLDEVPSDKLRLYKEKYTRLKLDEEKLPFGAFVLQEYYRTIDQFNELIRGLKKNPYSARHIVESWVPEALAIESMQPEHNAMIGRGALAPCHKTFQCFVKPPLVEGGKQRLVLWMHQRSVDTPVGAPYNIAQYSLLAHMLAKECDMEAVEFQWARGDTHIYSDQLEKVKIQLEREPLPSPTIWLNPEVKTIFDYKFEDIKIENYTYHEKIDYPVAK